jgi:LPS-assembly protein
LSLRRLIAATFLLIPCFSAPADDSTPVTHGADQTTEASDDLCGNSAEWSSYEPPPHFDADQIENTSISANQTRTDKQGSSEFQGDVVIERNQLRIRTDSARYDSQQDQVTVEGNVHVDTTGMAVDARRGDMWIPDSKYSFNDVEFFIPQSRLHGGAYAVASTGTDTFRLSDANLTSCPPDDVDWLLSADSIDIDHADEYGSAKDVWIEFQHVPIFYTPYIEFPIGDKRRSGLLAPEISQSSSRGVELLIPWYWNIAPQMDAIIAPHNMSRRGLALDGQYRYLTHSTEGQFDASYLADDNITGTERYALKYLQQSKLTSNVRLNIDYRDVSDSRYLTDFSSNLIGSSTTQLSRSANITAGYESWRMRALAQSFETLDDSIAPTARPYRMLPQLTLNGEEALGDNLFFTFDSEWVEFAHEFQEVTHGSRLRLKPGIRLSLQGSAWFFKPELKYSHTSYDVVDGSGADLNTDSIDVPISSIDSGLFFERSLDNGMVQTLEPRLFYLKIPYREQNALPLFDTSVPDFSLSRLFAENRFNGGDRVGDTNQLTLALTSRLINSENGDERLRASIGRIFYFDDRAVTLNGAAQTSTASDIIAELGGKWRKWSASTGLQWDTETRKGTKGNALLHYQGSNHSIFNAGYRRRLQSSTNPEAIEQTDFSLVAPLTREFTLLGRWNYSLEQQRNLETIVGIAYDSCCWSMILAGQSHFVGGSGIAGTNDYDNSVIFQLVFKGIGSVSGDSAVKTLKQSILGFSEDFQL